MPTLTVTDLAESPTGLSIQLDGGAAVAVYRVTGDPAAWPVVYSGTLPGAGVTVVLLPVGSYVVVAYGGPFSAAAHVAVTDGTEAVSTRSRNAIAERIALLGLPLYIYKMWNTVEPDVLYPCAILTTEGVQETREKSFNATDDIGRPVRVQICDRETTAENRQLKYWEKWRDRIERAFHNQQLPMNESFICRVEFGTITDRDLPHNQFMLSEFTIRHITREYRGL
jgi:hypothetical protein